VLGGETVDFTARIVDENGNNVSGGKVVFKVNGKTLKDDNGRVIYVGVNNGRVNLTYTTPLGWISSSNLTTSYVIGCVYSGSSIYNSSRATNGTITVAKRTTQLLITIPTEVKFTQIVTFRAVLTDSLINNSGIVIFKINGNTIKDDDGHIVYVNVVNNEALYDYTIPFNLSLKSYTITAVYSNPHYQRAENTTNITINRLNTYIKIFTKHTNNDTIHIEAELYDEYDNPLIGNINYVIKLNGVTFMSNSTTNSEIDVILGYSFKERIYSLSLVIGTNNKYNGSRNTTNLTLEKAKIDIELNNLYRCNNANIQLNINNQLLDTNTILEVYLDESNIYNSLINTTFINITQYIPIEYEGRYLLTLKVDNTNSTYITTKVIMIQSNYIYVNSQGNYTNNGTSKNDYTTLEKALQITTPEKIILLATNKTKDTYNMTNITISNSTTNSSKINIVGENRKNITFNGQNMNRLFNIDYDYDLTLLNINFINGYGYFGGVFVNQGNLTLINNTLKNNNAFLSSAIIENNGNLTLIRNIINNNTVLNNTRDLTTDNTTTANGGVINSYYGDVFLIDNNFYGNNAHYGGVIVTNHEIINSINNIFYNNHVKYSGGVLYLNNSTSFSYNDSYINNSAKYGSVSKLIKSLAYFINDTFEENSAQVYGTLEIEESSCEIYQSSFYNNSAKYGAGIYSLNSNILINETIFNYNIGLSHGGSISSINSNMQINNTIFQNNMVDNGVGGSLYIEKTNSLIANSTFINNSAIQGGAVIIIDENENILNNNTFTQNMAQEGGALYTTKSISYLDKCIFNNNTASKAGAVYSQLSHTINIENSVFQLNIASQYSNIYSYESVTYLNNNTIYSDDTKISVQTSKSISNINNNYWGTNNPNFNIITNNNTPKTWIIIENNTQETVYHHENISLLNSGINNLTISDNDNNIVTTKKAKKNINIIVDDVLTQMNENISINIIFSENITTDILITLPNSTVLVRTLNNSDHFIFNYTTGNIQTIERIILTIPENDYYATSTENINIFTQNTTSYFNLLDYSLVTPVKDQFSSPTCWAFASLSSLESSILKEYNISYDFSENHLKNILNKYSLVGTDTEANSGSSLLRPINYMVSWYDPILEEEEEFSEKSTIAMIKNATYHVQDVVIINKTEFQNITNVKELLLRYGAIYTDFNSEGRCDINKITYGNETINNTINYYSYEENNPTHAITIIGWDDNYSKYNFNNSNHFPEEDGAFIIKNSWGIAYGVNGINYVSYYDKSLAIRGSIAFSMENKNNYTSIYQHESCSVSAIKSNNSSVYMANNYKAKKNEQIQAVGTFFNNPSNYMVSIYKNGIEQYSQEGQVNISGYKTIHLNQYIPVNNNDNFTAIMKITTNTNNTQIFVQDSLEMTSNTLTNESFISYDGINWINLQQYKLTACLKVYAGYTNNTINNNNITQKKLNITLFEDRPTSIPDYINQNNAANNYSLLHFVIKIPTTRTVIENNTTIIKNFKRNIHLLLDNQDIALNESNYESGFYISDEGEVLSDYDEKEGIYVKKNYENYIEVHFIYNVTNNINNLSVHTYSSFFLFQGQVKNIIVNLNNEEKAIRLFIAHNGSNYYSNEEIVTQLIFNNQIIERIESINYSNHNPIYQNYVITDTIINNKTYLQAINNTTCDDVNKNLTKIALSIFYLNDVYAELISSILNVSYDRQNYTIVSSGNYENYTYVHIADPTMGLHIEADENDTIIFRLLTTYLLSLWEEKALKACNLTTEGALTKIINALETNSYQIFEEGNYTYVVLNDETNTTIIIDQNTGIVLDYVKIGNNIYHGTVADDQHNLIGFEVDSPQADFERFVGSTLMAASGYLLPVPGGIVVAGVVWVAGAVICADGCGLFNPNQCFNKTRLGNFGWDAITSFPYAHALGYISKFEKLSRIITKIEKIDKAFIKFENKFNNVLNDIHSSIIPVAERMLDGVGFDMLGINKLTQGVLKSYCRKLNLKIPQKEFSNLFNFAFEMDKKALFEGSHVDLATHEIFCENIDQLPTAATKFAYISYGLTKTAAEEMTEHTTETLMDLIKDTIKEYNKNVSNNVLNNVNEKRNDAWIDLGHKEYYYVEELTIFKGECTL